MGEQALRLKVVEGKPSAVVMTELDLTFHARACNPWTARPPATRYGCRPCLSPRPWPRAGPARQEALPLLGVWALCVSARGRIEVIVEPVPWRPRRDGKRRSRIVVSDSCRAAPVRWGEHMSLPAVHLQQPRRGPSVYRLHASRPDPRGDLAAYPVRRFPAVRSRSQPNTDRPSREADWARSLATKASKEGPAAVASRRRAC